MDSIEIAFYGGIVWVALFVIEHLWNYWSNRNDD